MNLRLTLIEHNAFAYNMDDDRDLFDEGSEMNNRDWLPCDQNLSNEKLE